MAIVRMEIHNPMEMEIQNPRNNIGANGDAWMMMMMMAIVKKVDKSKHMMFWILMNR